MATDEQTGITYNVVGYEDVRGLAIDAANTAVEGQRSRDDGDLQLVADTAASKAAESVAQQVTDRTDEQLKSVADDSAAAAVDGVKQEVSDALAKVQEVTDAQLQEIDARAASIDSVSVTLADEQWEVVQGSLQVVTTCSLLTLLMVCAVFGSVVARYFVEGWRR